MEKLKKVLSNINSSEIVLLVALVLSGGFNEFISCTISVIVSLLLTIKIAKNRCFTIRVNIVSISVGALALGYLISTFYAIDSGMAFLGFLKFMPVLLYMLLLMQNDDLREIIIAKLPYFALVLGLISFVLMFIPIAKDYFVVADRLAGFFQYPNSFAMFLLIGELVILLKEKYRLTDVLLAISLLLLLLLTGSRMVFVLAVFSNVLMLFFKKGKKYKIIIVALVALITLCIILFFSILKENDILARYFSISLNESTFIGRLLYYIDALPVILKHPFGLGYMGYYYIQQSIQTGVYSVKYIHNDFLQIMLDVGWVPCVLFILGIVKSIFSKTSSTGKRIILITFCAHCLFDFDLQFTAMFFILLLFLDFDSGKKAVLKKNCLFIVLMIVLSGLLSLYFAIALSLSYFNNYKASDAMYPFNTQNKISLLLTEDDIEIQNSISDNIISHNEYVQIAYSAKARYAYSQGDFENLIKYKNKIFQIAPFSYEEYEEYCYMLIQGIYLYQQIGDDYSAEICIQEIIDTADKLNGLEGKLSEFGKKIADQPGTELPDDILEYINSLEVVK